MDQFTVHVLDVDRHDERPRSVLGYFLFDILLRTWKLVAKQPADPDDLVLFFDQLCLAKDYDALDVLGPVAFDLIILTEYAV